MKPSNPSFSLGGNAKKNKNISTSVDRILKTCAETINMPSSEMVSISQSGLESEKQKRYLGGKKQIKVSNFSTIALADTTPV